MWYQEFQMPGASEEYVEAGGTGEEKDMGERKVRESLAIQMWSLIIAKVVSDVYIRWDCKYIHPNEDWQKFGRKI